MMYVMNDLLKLGTMAAVKVWGIVSLVILCCRKWEEDTVGKKQFVFAFVCFLFLKDRP